MTTAPRRAAPLVAVRHPAEPTVASRRRPARRRPSAPRRTAGSVGWWGASLVVASLAVTVLIGAATYERVGRRDVAVPALTAGLQHPTERVLRDELERDTGGDRVVVTADLVRIDVARADAVADPAAVARAAAAERAAELYERNLPRDPGPGRTQLGLSRSLAGVMSDDNHAKVERSLVAAAVMALALLAWCLLQGRNDNVLLLPACAVAGGWVLASAAKVLVVEMLSDVGPASDAFVHAIDTAAHQPLGLARTAAVGLLLGAAFYRFATITRLYVDRRRARIAAA